MPNSYKRKEASTDPRDQRLHRKRLLTELSAVPFAVPEGDYDTDPVPLRAVPHPLTPEIVPAPPKGNLRSTLRSTNWGLIGWGGVTTAVAACLAYVAVVTLEITDAKRLETVTASIQETLRSFVAEPPAARVPEAAKKIAEDFESLRIGRAEKPDTQQDADERLNRLMDWDRNSGATPAQ